jgi:hypothetical protein
MANLKISRMDYTSRIKGDDIFLLVQDGQNKIISAEDLVHNIDNALRNDKPDCHHHHYCGDDNP